MSDVLAPKSLPRSLAACHRLATSVSSSDVDTVPMTVVSIWGAILCSSYDTEYTFAPGPSSSSSSSSS
jgi:hypothetical protein